MYMLFIILMNTVAKQLSSQHYMLYFLIKLFVIWYFISLQIHIGGAAHNNHLQLPWAVRLKKKRGEIINVV